MSMMTIENTTLRKPGRSSGTWKVPRYVFALSKKRSHHSEQAMNKNDEMQLPVTLPMPPITTMSKISYVIADLNWLAWIVVWNIASSAPEMPAKKELMTNAKRLWCARLMPIASAATSSSRIALNARPYVELMSSTMIAIHTPDTANGNNTDLKMVYFRSKFEPFVTTPSLSHWNTARNISAKPSVAIAK